MDKAVVIQIGSVQELKRPILKDWEVIFEERRGLCLSGAIYNDSRFADGEQVVTSSIRAIAYPKVATKNTIYDLDMESCRMRKHFAFG